MTLAGGLLFSKIQSSATICSGNSENFCLKSLDGCEGEDQEVTEDGDKLWGRDCWVRMGTTGRHPARDGGSKSDVVYGPCGGCHPVALASWGG